MTGAFPEVAAAVGNLPHGTALDGELVILDDEGKPAFAYRPRLEDDGTSVLKSLR